jgi:hypothetical protein
MRFGLIRSKTQYHRAKGQLPELVVAAALVVAVVEAAAAAEVDFVVLVLAAAAADTAELVTPVNAKPPVRPATAATLAISVARRAPRAGCFGRDPAPAPLARLASRAAMRSAAVLPGAAPAAGTVVDSWSSLMPS